MSEQPVPERDVVVGADDHGGAHGGPGVGRDGAPPRPPRRLDVRRSPRYGVFIATGTALAAVLAAVLTFTQPASQYGYPATLGYLVVALGALGALLGATVAVVVGALVERRSRRRS